MYVNLHTLPPGHHMFTLIVNLKGTPIEEAEEYDMVVAVGATPPAEVVGEVIDTVRDDLVLCYGPTVEVVGVVDQSAGEIIFDSRQEGHIPLPVVIPTRLAEAHERPYDLLLALAQDTAAMGADSDGSYRDWLLGGE